VTTYSEVTHPWGVWFVEFIFTLFLIILIVLVVRYLKNKPEKKSITPVKKKVREPVLMRIPSAFFISKDRSMRNRMIATALIPLMLTLIGTTFYHDYIIDNPNEFLKEKIGPENIDDLRARWKALSFDENVRRVSFSLITEQGLLVHTSPDKTELLFSRIDDYEVISRFKMDSPCLAVDVNEKEKLLVACGTYDWSTEGNTYLYKYHLNNEGRPILNPVDFQLPAADRASFSPSGRYLAMNNYWNGTGGIYNVNDGSRLLNLTYSTIYFSPDESLVAWINQSYKANVMTFPEGELIYTFEELCSDRQGDYISWSADGSIIAQSSRKGVEIFDSSTFKVLNLLPQPNKQHFNPVISFSPDGDMLLIGYDGYCSQDESGYSEIVIMDALGMKTYCKIQEWTRGPYPYWSEPSEGLSMGEFPEYQQVKWKNDQSGFIVSSREYVVGGDLIHYAVAKVVVEDKVSILCFLPSFLSLMLIGGPIWIGLLQSPASMVRSLAQKKGISLLFLTCSIVTVILTGLSFHQTGVVKGWQDPFSFIDQANNLLISLTLSSVALGVFSAIVYLPGRKKRNFKDFLFSISIFIGFFCMLMIGFGIVESTLSALFPDVFWVRTLSWEFDVADLAISLNLEATHSIMTINYSYYGNAIVLSIWTLIATAILLIPTLALFRSFRSGLLMGRVRSGIGIALFTIGPVVYWFLSLIMLDRFYWESLFPWTGYGENMSIIDWWPNRYTIQNPFGSALLVLTLVGLIFIGIGSILSILPKGAIIAGKIDSPEKLSQRTRLLILAHLENSPGSGMEDMIRELNVSRGNIRYHLDILERNGEIDAFMDGLRKRYDLRRKGIPEGLDDLNLMMGAIEEFPGIDQAELTRIFGWSRSTVNRTLLELLSQGKVLRLKDGKVWKYFLSKGNG